MPDIGDFIRRSRRSAKIAIAAPGTPGDFRRSRRSAYKIARCVAGLMCQVFSQYNRNSNLNLILNTILPTFVTAHTFCASRDTRVSYGWCLLIQGYFNAVLKLSEKAELSKCYWYQKRKLGVTIHCSEIIKLQFGKKTP